MPLNIQPVPPPCSSPMFGVSPDWSEQLRLCAFSAHGDRSWGGHQQGIPQPSWLPATQTESLETLLSCWINPDLKPTHPFLNYNKSLVLLSRFELGFLLFAPQHILIREVGLSAPPRLHVAMGPPQYKTEQFPGGDKARTASGIGRIKLHFKN